MVKDEIRIILASDLHDCHVDWYGVPTEQRLGNMVEQLRTASFEEPVDTILLLGDYSLDFWVCDIGGSWLREGKSNTQHFMEHYASRLPCRYAMIPGNHEQYGEAAFQRITGFRRQGTVVTGDVVFLLLDTFSRNLDPREHSDGTYTPVDTAAVRTELEKYPGKKCFLCAHYFDLEKEGESFRELVRDERIVGLFQGHTHRSACIPLGEEYGGKYIVQTGNYSYSSEKDPRSSFWGWRELRIIPHHAASWYYTPENDALLDGAPYHHAEGRQDEIEWAL